MEFLKKHARLPRLAMESERYTSVYSLLHKMPLDDSEAEPPAISVSALGGDRDPMNRCAAPLPPTPLPLAVLPPVSDLQRHAHRLLLAQGVYLRGGDCVTRLGTWGNSLGTSGNSLGLSLIRI